jgi:hypothetical protein
LSGDVGVGQLGEIRFMDDRVDRLFRGKG